jgi:arsenite-transporting ATPase
MPRSKGTSTVDRALTPSTRYRLVGGKGGVGKTTCAAAMALASAAAGRRTLVISTDPAPSLADALDVPLGRAPRAVPGTRGKLDALEVDAAAAVRAWIRPRAARLETIALRGTWLDRDDVAALLELSLPGIDELAALLEIARYGGSSRYDLVVVDTAPTGHTLRMLDMPETLGGVASVFDHMQAKHRVMVDALRGSWHPDEADRMIERLEADARELRALLTDRQRTEVAWVTLPEPMAVEETIDAVRALAAHGMAVKSLVVNRVTVASDPSCTWCRARRALETEAIAVLRSRLAGARVLMVQAIEREPVGARALRAIGSALSRDAPVARARSAAVRARITGDPVAVRGRCQLIDVPTTRIVMFGGKGGVGKTTAAAAAALDTARRNPRTRILLLSADPAHSLSDVLGVTVADVAAPLGRATSNLHIRELDPSAAFRRVREQYASAIDRVFDALTRGSAIDIAHDRRVMHELIDLAPPGSDELAAILEVTEALDRSKGPAGYDLVVLDTAPTGHALRLLEMPALVHDWTKALMRIVLKYQAVVRVGEIGAVLLRLSRGLGRLRGLLADPARARFVVVTRPAILPRQETTRLLKALRRARMEVSAVVVNAVGQGTCGRCRRAARAEHREVQALVRLLRTVAPRAALVIAPAEMPPPHGPASLLAWQHCWHSLELSASACRPDS